MRTKKQKDTKAEEVVVVKHRPLGTHLEKSGFAIDVIKREGDVVLCKRQRIRKPWCDFESPIHFEIAIIKRHNGYYLGEQYIEPAETYPCNSLWGILGWTATTPVESEVLFQKALLRIKSKDVSVDESIASSSKE